MKLSLSNISHKIEVLEKKEEEFSFFDIASHLEQIQANATTFAEILSPFSYEDFSTIYQKILDLPISLQPLISSTLHVSSMTSIAGILKNKNLHVLYGENTYFECVKAVKWASRATSTLEATEEQFSSADLILAQFNPSWSGINGVKDKYRVEDIPLFLHKAFKNRQKPLILALDCTIDYIFSENIKNLFEEFKYKILEGRLCIICYRSGTKFDLFGMDNYCGAPFYIINDNSNTWNFLRSLTEDPALKTDLLSLQWFCLTYLYAAEEIDLYRKYLFENTKSLLQKIPSSLFNGKMYQIIPFDEKGNPVFLDIIVKSPFHALKIKALVGGNLGIKCLESNLPVFHRMSLGMCHTNLSILTSVKYSTLR
ncbi:MAG: hypothetical protein V4489_02045 [Chlamydiota bacterium]